MYYIKPLLAVSVVGAALLSLPKAPLSSEELCGTLDRVISGETLIAADRVNQMGFENQLSGHANMLDTLYQAAPLGRIKLDLLRLKSTFAEWSEMGTSWIPAELVFMQLYGQGLVETEGRISQYFAQQCGVDLGREAKFDDAFKDSTNCPGWGSTTNINNRNRFPYYVDTTGSNYFANNFYSESNTITRLAGDRFNEVEKGGWVEFRGQFPKARHFGFNPNDQDLNNFPVLIDEAINPDPGSVNPYRQNNRYAKGNYYTVKYIFSAPPSEGSEDPNVVYVGTSKRGEENTQLTNLLRYYASDDATEGKGLINSGGVPLPSVTIYNADGSLRKQFDECDPYPEGYVAPTDHTTLAALPIPDYRATYPAEFQESWAFGLPTDMLTNAAAVYTRLIYSKRYGDIYVVRGKHFKTPDTRSGDPSWLPGQDIRGWTACNYNFWAGDAQTCRVESQLTSDEEGYYTMVIASEADKPSNLGEQKATWFDWGPFLDGQLSVRYFPRTDSKAQALLAAYQDNNISPEIAPHLPQAVACDRLTFERGGWRACFALNVSTSEVPR